MIKSTRRQGLTPQPQCVMQAQEHLRESFFSSSKKIKELLLHNEIPLDKANKLELPIKKKAYQHIQSVFKIPRTEEVKFSQLYAKEYAYVLGRKDQSVFFEYEGNYKSYKCAVEVNQEDKTSKVVLMEIINKKKKSEKRCYRNHIPPESLPASDDYKTLVRSCKFTSENAFYRIHPVSHWKTDASNLALYLKQYYFTIKLFKDNLALFNKQLLSYLFWTFEQSIIGLKQYHKKNRHHGDIKLGNMLVSTNEINIIDDISDSLSKKRIHNTVETMSPDNPVDFFTKAENKKNKADNYFTKPDIYSLGLELFNLLARFIIPDMYRKIVEFEATLKKTFHDEMCKHEFSPTKTCRSPQIIELVLSHNVKIRNFIINYKNSSHRVIPYIKPLLDCCFHMLDAIPETRHMNSIPTLGSTRE